MPRVIAFLIVAVSVVACSKTDKAADTSAAVPATPAVAAPVASPTPAPISLAQLVGTWHGKSMPEGKDTVLSTWTLVVPADSTKWETTFSNGLKVPVRVVAVAGDSVVAEMGPYKSISLKGKMVTARLVTRLQGDKMIGNAEMRLASKPDSVTRLRLEGTK